MSTRSIRLELLGELDYAREASVYRCLVDAGAEAPEVLVGLAGVEFIDSAGLRALIEATVTLRIRDVRLIFCDAPDHVMWLLRTTGLETVLALQ